MEEKLSSLVEISGKINKQRQRENACKDENRSWREALADSSQEANFQKTAANFFASVPTSSKSVPTSTKPVRCVEKKEIDTFKHAESVSFCKTSDPINDDEMVSVTEPPPISPLQSLQSSASDDGDDEVSLTYPGIHQHNSIKLCASLFCV